MPHKTYPKILSPDGIEYEITHLSDFAKEHGLHQGNMSQVLNGKRKQHKGWSLAPEGEQEWDTLISQKD